MRKRRASNEDIIKQAKASRDRSAKTAKKTATLIHKAARLEETIRQTEEKVRDLEAIVGTKYKAAAGARRLRSG